MTGDTLTDAQYTERLLDAGAVLPLGTATRDDGADGADRTADVLTARGYRHPGLDGRTVVRLVPGALGAAEDLAVEFLGLSPAGDPLEVGLVRQEALGFPAWALVHDPANGHHALAVVKEMERLARQVKSKPGHAKDGFDELAVRLGRAVPHFLPTYCEQVGRIFLEQGNQSYAAVFFGRAREAERTHGLEVDEERLRAVFLEFALNGALTVKALRQYVKDLAGRLDALTAWQRFRQLCTERSASGMAPYAGIAEDARALIRAAGLDLAEQERTLVVDLLSSPAIGRAPGGVWKAWRGPLVEAARGDAAVRARLLEILPTPSGAQDNGAVDGQWLELLRDTGAQDLLTDPQHRGAEPAARWLERWTAHLNRGWRSRPGCAATVELATRMTGRLRAEAVPVALNPNHPTALNLLDLLLAERVPVTDPPAHPRTDLRAWLREGGPGRRDLAAAAADPRFRPALREAVPPLWAAADADQLDALEEQYPALRELFVEWSDLQADELLALRGLSAAHSQVSWLDTYDRAIAAANPAAAARIAGLDVAALLGHTLREGILDELGWPALEEGLRLLSGDGTATRPPADRDALRIENAWPALVLARRDKAVVVGPEGILLEHDLRLPAGLSSWHGPALRYADGELLVAWWEDGGQRAYWSGRPDQVFTPVGEHLETGHHGARSTAPTSLPLPGGGRATGGRPLHAGDTAMPPEHRVLGDGTGYWTVRRKGDRTVLTEYDPLTGQHGRTSVPPLFAAHPDDPTGTLRPELSRLLPLQPGLERTPLGTDGALLGGWVRSEGDRTTFHGVDGRRTTLLRHGPHDDRHPAGRLALPGGAAPVLAANSHRAELLPPDGAGGALVDVLLGQSGGQAAAGTALVPPIDFWHALRPRDEAGSLVLRALTDRQAAEILAAARPVPAPDAPALPALPVPPPLSGLDLLRAPAVPRPTASRPAPPARSASLDAVAAALPGLTDPLLAAGVAGLVRMAVATEARAARFGPRPAPAAPAAPAPAAPVPAAHRPEHGRDGQLADALQAVLHSTEGLGSSWNRPTDQWHVLGNLRAVTAVLAAPPQQRPAEWTADPERLPLLGDGSHHGWLPLLGRTAPLALAAALPVTDEPVRATLLLLLEELTRGWLAGRGPELREVTLSEENDSGRSPSEVIAFRQGQVLRHGERTVVLLACRRYGPYVQWHAVDHDPSGAFGPVAHFGTVQERPVHDDLTARWVARFTAALRQHGPLAWRPEQVQAFGEATGTGPTRAALLLAEPVGGLPTERLADYGLRSTGADEARRWLRAVPRADLDATRAALLPADPERLWDEGLATDTAAACWTARRGRLLTLPEEMRANTTGTDILTVEALLNPATTPWLSRTTVQRVRTAESGAHLVGDDPEALPHHRDLIGAVDALRWLAHHLPYGSPVRQALPQTLATVRARLADPGLLLDLGPYSNVRDRQLTHVLRAHLGLPEQGGAGSDGLLTCTEALVIAPGHYGEHAHLRPAALDGPDDPLLDLLTGLIAPYYALDLLHALRALLGEELTRLTAHGSAADEPDGWPQDPQRSVPDLVAEVAGATGLDQDAAVLYLQLLALPDPTDRNTARWTGWKPARLKRARAALAAADGGLVLEAKRARAGRGLFLPGGWQEAKAPALPVEVWKGGLYPIPTHAPALPPLPAPELFARAWQRVTDGDRPGYEQLTTGGRGRKRR
ncbi:hypothetical protein ACFV6F_31545 [Kitasatospora phosalacinea]|uniref:hypothetical protein n=1 Tax=Kitasatospora phosalacinea TaxID=2065 RepID=UPI00365184BA